jgi:hypothetical protein
VPRQPLMQWPLILDRDGVEVGLMSEVVPGSR